ncbi:hypothetical protein Tco_1019470 [Tanacetum coccineum]|uniref:Uncharacterized protein n=1 Tax=Tanacetum coccineum TaxID=301880 RepID=A0ABQ5FXH9_9ASTR
MKALFYDPLIYNDNDIDVVENVDLAEGVTASEEVVNDEIEIEDISEFVGSEQVVEEDVVIPNIGLNDRFLNKLVNYKYISDKDVGASLGINSSSSRDVEVEDSSVDNIYKVKEGVSYHEYCSFVKEGRCSNKKGKQKVDENICTPNSKSMSKAKQIKSSKSKSKSNSPKTPELPKTPKSSKTPKVTHNTDASQKGQSKWQFMIMKEDTKTIMEGYEITENISWPPTLVLQFTWIYERWAERIMQKSHETGWLFFVCHLQRSCDAFGNGVSESYHSAIGFAKSKPIITMLDEIRVCLMQRLVAKTQKAMNLDDIICPSNRKEIEKLKESQRRRKNRIKHATENVYELSKTGEKKRSSLADGLLAKIEALALRKLAMFEWDPLS